MISGVWAALPSFSSLGWDAQNRAVSHLFDRGIEGIFYQGTTGRGTELPISERMTALERTIHAIGSGEKVVVAVSANPAADVRTLIEHAAQTGVAGVALTPPFYGLRSDEELLDWFTDVASRQFPAVDVYLYQIPNATKNGWNVKLLEEVGKMVPVSGVKDSSGNPAQLFSFLEWRRNQQRSSHAVSVMVGDERLAVMNVMLGGQGFVSGLAVAHPELMVSAYRAATAADWDAAAQVQTEINRTLALLDGVSPRRVADVLLGWGADRHIF